MLPGFNPRPFALDYLAESSESKTFINADLIAAGISPLQPEIATRAASRLFLQQIQQCVAAQVSFAFETTLSSRGYLRLIRNLKQAGWQVELIYLALPSVRISLERVRERVAHGGHSILEDAIYRRFPRSLRNLLNEYAGLVDYTLCLMNDSEEPVTVFEQDTERGRYIIHQEAYRLLQKQSSVGEKS